MSWGDHLPGSRESEPLNMSADSATLLAAILIIVVIGVRIVTGSILNSSKRALAEVNGRLRAVRVDLEFARERRKAAENVLYFSERQKEDLYGKIELHKEDLETMEKEEAGGAEGGEEGDEDATLVPRHMRTRDDLFKRR